MELKTKEQIIKFKIGDNIQNQHEKAAQKLRFFFVKYG